MVDEERIYTIPLRKEFLKVPKWKRTKKSVIAVRQFLVKHMKSDNVKIGKYLNQELWNRGMKNPPCRVKVKVTKDKDNVVRAELVNVPVEKVKVKKGKEEPKIKKELEKLEKKTEDIKEKKVDELKKEKEEVLKEGFEKEVREKPRREEKEWDKEDDQKLRMDKIITDSKRKGHTREKR